MARDNTFVYIVWSARPGEQNWQLCTTRLVLNNMIAELTRQGYATIVYKAKRMDVPQSVPINEMSEAEKE